MFDVHALVMLQQQLAVLLTDSAAWLVAMGGDRVQSDVAEGWRTELAAGEIQFVTGYTNEPPRKRSVNVILREASPKQDIDAFGFVDAGDESTLFTAVDGSVTIRVFAEVPELTRALWFATKAAMLNSKDIWHAGGYSELQYRGGGDMDMRREWFGATLVMTGREHRWSALYDQRASVVDPATNLPIVVGATDVIFTVPGGTTLGGVTGET